MDNKLSELSKPIGVAFKSDIELMQSGRMIHGQMTVCRGCAENQVTEGVYSQEYVSALKREAAVNWEAAASLNVENQELKKRIGELEQAMRHIHGAAVNITVPRVAIAKAAELAVEHASMKEQSNG